MSNIITVTNLIRKFKDFTAVDDITFDVRQGEIFAFLGPNGAGKSTTIKMLTTLLKPTGGKIIINGNDPVENKHEARKSFGIVFQDASIDDNMTAYENMYFHAVLYKVPGEIRKNLILELLRFVELESRKKEFVKTFSGGMKRRLEIARGLLHNPKILFLDEPTLGLDPQTRNHIWNYIKVINKNDGMTVFFTTHYMEEAEKIADRIAIMDHGKIIVIGTPAELINKTASANLEEAFLTLTGKSIREEEASGIDRIRMMRRISRRR
jgi:ABC-2 type transport system ATP-binding protein